MTKIREIFAKNLNSLRKERRLTQQNLAELSTLSISTIAYLETSRMWPGDETVHKLAEALKVDEARFFVDPELIILPTIQESLTVICDALGMEPPRPKKEVRDRKE